MAKSKRSYGEGVTGRDILDNICEQNRMRNPEAYDAACGIPGYLGQALIGAKVTKLDTITGRSKMKPSSFISDVIYAAENLQMDRQNAIIKLSRENGGGIVSTDESLIRFLKACIACSYNPNEDFSFTLSEFAKKVLSSADSLILPIEVPTAGSKVRKIVLQELNDHLKKICDEHSIPYSSVVDEPKRRRKRVGELLEQAAN